MICEHCSVYRDALLRVLPFPERQVWGALSYKPRTVEQVALLASEIEARDVPVFLSKLKRRGLAVVESGRWRAT
jgi:hypothetical protein